MPPRIPPRTNVLGVGVSVIDVPTAVEEIAGWIDRGERRYVCVTGVHGVMESRRDPELRGIHNRAGLVVPDGMPLVWLSRLAGHSGVDRCYGPDLMLAACEASVERGWRHFLYGGGEGVAELLKDRLERRFPGLRIVGTYTPPFRPLTGEEEEEVRRVVEGSGADLVWVGLSTPKQERWMADHVDELPASALLGVGAAFDFLAGLKRQAPRWLQRTGLEWLFRLVTEPRRLWRRYLRNNPAFLAHLTLQRLGLRRYPIEP